MTQLAHEQYPFWKVIPVSVVEAIKGIAVDDEARLLSVSEAFAIRVSQLKEIIEALAVLEDNPWHKADGTFGIDRKGSWSFQFSRKGKKQRDPRTGKMKGSVPSAPWAAADGQKSKKSKAPCGRNARRNGKNIRCQDSIDLGDLRALVEYVTTRESATID